MEELQEKLLELESRLKSLQFENESLKKIQIEGLKKQYTEIYDAIQYAVEHGDRLELAHKELETKMSQSVLFSLLTEVSNPLSGETGLDLKDVIKRHTTDHFTKEITNPEIKEKFSAIVNRVVNNDIVAALLNSNPVTGVIYRLVDKITDFSNNNPIGIKLNKWEEDVKDVFKDERINKFVESLMKYSAFYEDFHQASNQYQISSQGLSQRRESLGKVLNTYYSDLLKELGIEPRSGVSSLPSVNKLLAVDGEKYQDVINNPKVISAYEKAREYRSLEERFNNLLHDYNEILSQYFDTYLVVLENMKNSSLKDFDHKKIDDIMMKISNR